MKYLVKAWRWASSLPGIAVVVGVIGAMLYAVIHRLGRRSHQIDSLEVQEELREERDEIRTEANAERDEITRNERARIDELKLELEDRLLEPLSEEDAAEEARRAQAWLDQL